jgi:PAS domain S-box-containing protein
VSRTAATILIVYDLSADRAFLATVLRHHGHRLLEAANGAEGLAIAQREKPDLVITDILMPVMDGYELVRQLRLSAATRSTPVVLYTAYYGEREARDLATSSGAIFILTKPTGIVEVLRVVTHALTGEPDLGDSSGRAGPATEGDREHLRLQSGPRSDSGHSSNARLRALINIGLELASERDTRRMLERACAAARDVFGASHVTLGILDRHDIIVQSVVICGAGSRAWIQIGDALPPVLASVITERRSFRTDNPGGAPATLGLPELHPEVRAFLAVPIASPTQLYGWLSLAGNEGRSFSEDDEHLVLALSAQIGRIFESLCVAELAESRARELEREIVERGKAEDALRKSERLISDLVDHLPHRILVKDLNSVIKYCNSNYAKDLGVSAADVIGKDAFAFYSPELAALYNADDRWVMSNGAAKDIEERHQLAGEERWVHTVKVPYRNANGEVVGILVVFEDITDRKRLEDQLSQSQKMEAVGCLAGGIAHDFNNLLTVILGTCELLRGGLADDDPRQREVSEIQGAGDRAAELTRQLLAFSRKETTQPTLLDLNTVLNDIRSLVGRLIREDVKMEFVLLPGLSLVKADRAQVEQILLNLVVNARDAMPRGGTLTIETADVELDGRQGSSHFSVNAGPCVMLRVTDSGTGMTAQVKNRLFEPFFTTKPAGQGTGLGLATVHGIIQRAGGSIRVESEPGRGASFEVYFPRAGPSEVLVEPVVPVQLSRAATETVLLVEDSDGIRALARRLLDRMGYQVLVAADAPAAIRLFDANPTVDVLLTDVVMPGESGTELAARLLKTRPGLKVIYMSGYTEAADSLIHLGHLDTGMAFLQKPFTSQALEQKLCDVLDGPERSLVAAARTAPIAPPYSLNRRTS